MDGVRGLLHGARIIGWANSLRAVRYTRARDRADRALPPRPRQPFRVPGPARGAECTDEGIRVRFTDATLEIRFPRPGQVSVGWDDALALLSYAVVDAGRPRRPQLTETEEGWLVCGPGVSVAVARDGALSVRDAEGRVRRSDGPPQWQGSAWTLRTALLPGQTLHGLGGRSAGWDLRGGTFRCWNTDPGGAWLPGDDPLYVTTPVLTVLDDLGAVQAFVDNTCDGTIDTVGEQVVQRFEAGPVRLHVSVGSLAEVMDAWTALTGRPAAPPRWALGYHQARWGYGSSRAVREVGRRFAEHRLPVSALHVDIDHMERFRNFSFGTQEWSDAEAMVQELADAGVRVVVIVDAGLARSRAYPVYREALAGRHLCQVAEGRPLEGVVWPGPTVFPDFTAAATREWWGEQLSFYARLGVAGYWHDMNEPACFVAWGDPTFPLATRHDLDGNPADHRTAHNVYGLQMSRASYEGLRLLQPDRRPFLFSRSGWAGMQRYGGHWTGDIQTDWAALRASLTHCLGYGVSGVGYSGPDIGGFTGTPSPELFTRWFQLASFLPFFRTHCAWYLPRREPWEWGEEVLGRLRVALERRYRLLPLWYSLALEAGRSGAPYVRPLAWADPSLRGSGEEFLLGDDVLVAPVLDEGATVRRLRLPAGGWVHGDTGERHEGAVELPVGLDDTPWFVRAGAVVPTEEDGRLVLLVAPPEPGRPAPGGRLLTDAGDGWAAPHEERYAVAEHDGTTVVSREVVTQGDFGFTGVEVRTLGGGPARLA
ncbi:MAG TPA: glycoside hydrolase family 31 protein [Nocardioides sp.]|uniref:glycoside hydrolase family 31 protein n=1 Tax=Nocardioides sp. TaxID=35761 RepID=UPI002C6D8104|nr:glycoside hydrolase family 31 protein [Nocardioides sp.]HQR27974.1 glycoside hydrolase family 31 protein [Nocardioides sp.]